MDLNARVDRYLRNAGLAIESVSIGSPGERSTWTVQPPHLQSAAQPHLDAYVLPTAQELAEDEAMREADLRILRAIVVELHAIIPAPKPTLVQLRRNIIDRYKALG